mgnify:CR=1 FL=1
MNDMESVYDANSLLDAFNKSKKGTAWKESVQRYEMNLLRNINQTQKELKDGTYEQKDFYEFKLIYLMITAEMLQLICTSICQPVHLTTEQSVLSFLDFIQIRT